MSRKVVQIELKDGAFIRGYLDGRDESDQVWMIHTKFVWDIMMREWRDYDHIIEMKAGFKIVEAGESAESIERSIAFMCHMVMREEVKHETLQLPRGGFAF
jgi:hypothetical protein